MLRSALLSEHGAAIGPCAIAVYVALLLHAREKPTCYPGLETIGKLVGLSGRRVRDAVGRLIRAGLVEAKQADGLATAYTLLLRHTPDVSSGVSGVTQDETSGPTPDETSAEVIQKQEEVKASAAAQAPAAGQTSFLGFGEPKGNGTGRKSKSRPKGPRGVDAPIPAAIDSPEIRAIWPKRLRQLSERHAALGFTAATAALAKLERMGPDRALAALKHSIEENYIAIVEPRGSNGNGAPKPKPIPFQQQKRQAIERLLDDCGSDALLARFKPRFEAMTSEAELAELVAEYRPAIAAWRQQRDAPPTGRPA